MRLIPPGVMQWLVPAAAIALLRRPTKGRENKQSALWKRCEAETEKLLHSPMNPELTTSAAVPMTRHISPVNGAVFSASTEKPAWTCSGAGRENGVNQRTTLSKAGSVMIGRGRQRGGQLPCPSCR